MADQAQAAPSVTCVAEVDSDVLLHLDSKCETLTPSQTSIVPSAAHLWCHVLWSDKVDVVAAMAAGSNSSSSSNIVVNHCYSVACTRAHFNGMGKASQHAAVAGVYASPLQLQHPVSQLLPCQLKACNTAHQTEFQKAGRLFTTGAQQNPIAANGNTPCMCEADAGPSAGTKRRVAAATAGAAMGRPSIS